MIILNRLIMGGTAMNTLHLVNALRKEYKVVLVTGEREKDEKDFPSDMLPAGEVEYIQLHSLKRSVNLFTDAKAYREIKGLIKKYQPVIVQTIGAKPGFLGRVAAWRLRVPVIIHAYHGHVFHSYFHPILSRIVVQLERWAAAKSTCITTVSAKQQKDLAQVYRIADVNKIIHLPIGIEVEKFNDPGGLLRKSFRTKYLLEEDEIAIGIAGRIAEVKNHPFFLQVADSFKNYRDKKLRFFIIGDGATIRRKLENELHSKKTDFVYFPQTPRKAYITFTSWIAEIEAVMNGLDIIVLTSHNEGTPVSLIEAMAAQRPVVATNVGAVSEVVQHNLSGFICEPGDIAAFHEKLQLLIDDPTLRKCMGEKGQQFILDHFHLSRQIAKTFQLYHRLLPGNSQNA